MINSMSPPPRPSSNNPFIEDSSVEQTAVRRHGSLGRGSREVNSPQRRSSGRHITSSEEKEALRRKYLQIDGEDVEGRSADLPPSYDEVAGDKHSRNRAPREKQHSSRDSRQRSSAHHSYHHSSESRRRTKSSSGKKSSSSPEKMSKSKSSAVPKNVDTIDKLDVTGLFGGAFHHDGPFDACTPHRNKNTKVAPVLAFPADGPNSSISGVGGGKSAIKEVFGHNDADEDDYLYESGRSNNFKGVVASGSSSTIDAIKPHNRVMQFDTKARTELVHGPTTVGLGSTTFLDGAPAAKSEQKEDILRKDHQGLQRKKSLSQRLKVGTKNDDVRLRKVSSDSLPTSPPVATFNESGVEDDEFYLQSPTDLRFDSNTKKESTGNKFLRRVKSLKVSRK